MNHSSSPHHDHTGVRLIRAGIGALLGALLMNIWLVAAAHAEHPLAWSWVMQISAIAFGAALGVLLGHRRRPRT